MTATYIVCESACSVALEITTPFYALTPADGARIAGAILAIWAIGLAFRLAIRTLRHTDGVSSTSED